MDRRVHTEGFYDDDDSDDIGGYELNQLPDGDYQIDEEDE